MFIDDVMDEGAIKGAIEGANDFIDDVFYLLYVIMLY